MGEKQYEPVAQVVTIAPAIDYDASLKAPSTKQSTWSNPSWRQSLIGGAIACLVVFLTNLAVTIWSIFLPNGSEYGAETGRRIMFEGSCEESRNLSIVLHLVINILGTVLLAASNYCMQCLSAPNRDEVDRAHAKNQWLDIGILSFRNLRRISRKRAVLWWLLVLSSVPLHLLYNSVVFSSLTNYDYSVFTVDDRLNLPEHLPFFTYTKAQRIEHTWNRLRAGEFDNLTNIDCMAEYATAFQTSRNHVMLVSDPGDDWDGKSEIFQEELAYLGSSWVADCPPQVYEWICPTATCQETCRSLLPEVERNADDWRPYGYRVKYCLSEPRPQLCRLNFSVYLAAAVLAVNLFKALIIAYVAFRPPKEPLFILGDAIQSFMVSPDAFSEGSCLASADMIRKGKNWMGPHPLSPARRRWAAAVSRRRWIFSSVVYCIALGLSLFFLIWGIQHIIGPRDMTSLWNLGFGYVSETALITGLQFVDDARPESLIWNVLISNMPQLIFSMLYFQYNGLFTCMTAAREWSSFAVRRRPLRVSWDPRGQQRSQYFLELPYHFSIPLLVVSIVMHWMLSQSIFIVAVETIREPNAMFWGLLTSGYSPVAIMFVIVGSVIMVLAVAIMACRRLPSNMPVVGSCSLAIAAACHPPKDRLGLRRVPHPDAAQLPLRWGVMDVTNVDGNGTGSNIESRILDHCGFSHEHVEDAHPGVSYS